MKATMISILVLVCVSFVAVDAEKSAPATPLQASIDGLFKKAAHHDGSLLDLERHYFESSQSIHRHGDTAKAEADAKHLHKMLEESGMSESRREKAESIVAGIEKDLRRMQHASPALKANLMKATKLRTQAIRELIHSAPGRPQQTFEKSHHLLTDLSKFDEDEPENLYAADDEANDDVESVAEVAGDDEEDDEPPVASSKSKNSILAAEHRVETDIARLRAKVHASHLSHKRELEVMDNLKHIESDSKKVAEMSHCHSGKECNRRDNLRKALSIRMKVLHQELEEDSESTFKSHNFEEAEGDADAEEDEKKSEEVEKKDESASTKFVKKITADISRMQEAIRNAIGMPSETKKEAKKNTVQIKRDAEEYATSHDSKRKADLKQAMSLRMKALHKELEENTKELEEEDTDSTPKTAIKSNTVSKISVDVQRMQDMIRNTPLNSKIKAEAKENVANINRDAKEYASTQNSARKAHLKQAISLRMKALHKELEESSPAPKHSTHEKVKAVENDLSELEEKIENGAFNKALKKEAIDNLHAIGKDARLLSGVTGEKRSHLKQTLSKRIEALKQEMNQPVKAKAPLAKESSVNHKAQDKVLQDVKDISNALNSKSMKNTPSSLRKEMEENLNAIQKDVKKMSSVDSSKKTALTTAIQYRMNALKSEMKLAKAKRYH